MQFVVNCEEFIGKTVGRRKLPGDSLMFSSVLQEAAWSFARPRIQKGVYRFRSHEEADQWLMDHLTRKQED